MVDPQSSSNPISPPEQEESRDFIREIVRQDIAAGTYGGQVVTRFPPEPNGYLHIGHAKSIVLNFGLAEEFGGRCHLRFDDTNPTTEDIEYVESIKEAIHWLGYDWGEHLYFASDYFDKLYQFAETLIRMGDAYVDSLSEEEIRQYRGTVTEPGRESPYRNRSIEENLELFRRMRAGEFADGEHVLRAKIDMSSPNMIMRDPILYRIRHAHHYRKGDAWCIYPLYDFAHPLSDGIERVTHSICTLEFENNRAIYNWLVDRLIEPPQPRQYEFARLNLDYTIMSKRKLLQLVKEKLVQGWDDPRMPTLVGMRRRGITPEAIRTFAKRVGVAKVNSRVEIELFEHVIRDDLNYRSPRVMAVLRPLKVIISNYPEDREEWLDAPYWPRDIAKEGSRQVPFCRELLIEEDDFAENPPPGFKRLAPGREVRLRYSYVVRCDEVIKDETGAIKEIRCTYDPDTLGARPRGRKVHGTIHWVSARHAIPAEVRLYDRLFTVPNPEDVEEGKSFKDYLNPDSLTVLRDARLEPSIASDPEDTRYQFERQGYFIRDRIDSHPDALVFNRIITLRDTWAKKQRPSATPPSRPADTPPAPTKTTVGTLSSERQRQREAHPALATAYEQLQNEYQLNQQDADLLTGSEETYAFFMSVVEAYPAPQ
ncbi:MAG: glutamine--tRNA ligase/YqeY domain fusion protein, partial [Chloroflexi bacterium]|nr:glutamine--tRNA ligase/YqeY domain fusion protein [Chloroflexota bacterium]